MVHLKSWEYAMAKGRKKVDPSHQRILDGKNEALRRRAIAEKMSQHKEIPQMRNSQGTSQQLASSAQLAPGSSITAANSNQFMQVLQQQANVPGVYQAATQHLQLMQAQAQQQQMSLPKASTPVTTTSITATPTVKMIGNFKSHIETDKLAGFFEQPQDHEAFTAIIPAKSNFTAFPAHTELFTKMAHDVTLEGLVNGNLFIIASEFNYTKGKVVLNIETALSAVVINTESRDHCALASQYLSEIMTHQKSFNFSVLTVRNQEINEMKIETAQQLQSAIDYLDQILFCENTSTLVSQRYHIKMQHQRDAAVIAETHTKKRKIETNKRDSGTQTENFLLHTPVTTQPMATSKPLNLVVSPVAATAVKATYQAIPDDCQALRPITEDEIAQAKNYSTEDIQQMNIEQTVRTGLALLYENKSRALYCTLKAATAEIESSNTNEMSYRLQARRNLNIFLNQELKGQDAVFLKPENHPADHILCQWFNENFSYIAWVVINKFNDGLQNDPLLIEKFKQAALGILNAQRNTRRGSIVVPSTPDQPQPRKKSKRKNAPKDAQTSAGPQNKKSRQDGTEENEGLVTDLAVCQVQPTQSIEYETDSEDGYMKPSPCEDRSKKRKVAVTDESDEDELGNIPLSKCIAKQHRHKIHNKLNGPVAAADTQKTLGSSAKSQDVSTSEKAILISSSSSGLSSDKHSASHNGAGFFTTPKPTTEQDLSVCRKNQGAQ